MNKLLKAGITIGLITFSATNVYATDTTGNATADISTVIALTENTPMAFGDILKDAVAGTLVLGTAGAITGAPGTYVLAGAPSAGQFTANGDASATVAISFSTGDTLISGANSMTLGTFTHNAGVTPALDGTGALTFNVGASLTVGATQATGAYSGTYTVTVNYL